MKWIEGLATCGDGFRVERKNTDKETQVTHSLTPLTRIALQLPCPLSQNSTFITPVPSSLLHLT